ncbi:MAG: tRNA (adenosine(37)-N6)-dimethylallyltransferase MiaA, partial [Acidimicrobiia bacterium]|nr:tRNA (adenosine(37)-N6)-dimethylallyltransferase MiaA [Acidimicrobiia bacterium]
MELARRMGASILSVDSMQVYRGMDIGTAKPSAAECAEIAHHMIDLVEPEEEFSVAAFQAASREVIEHAEGDVVVAGGSGLHFRAVVDPLEFGATDPEVRADLESRPAPDLVARLAQIDPDAPVDTSNPRRVIRALEVYELTGETPSDRAKRPSARAVNEYRPLLPFRAVGLDPG